MNPAECDPVADALRQAMGTPIDADLLRGITPTADVTWVSAKGLAQMEAPEEPTLTLLRMARERRECPGGEECQC